MKLTTLKERIANAEAKIARKQGTIEKKTATIAKKQAKLVKLGFDAEATENECIKNDEAFWLAVDIKRLREDIERGGREIEETKKTLENYKAQLAGAVERESIITREIPESMKRMQTELVTEWDRFDKQHRDTVREAYAALGYKQFLKEFSYADYELRYKTNDEIHRDNVNAAEAFVLNLYNRVKEITGEVTDWKGIHLEEGTDWFPTLNGTVRGKEGTATVESILAGGDNIQRLHVRVLVKEHK